MEWEELFLENQATKFRVHTKMSSRIGVLRIFPGITAEAVSYKLHFDSKHSLSPISDNMMHIPGYIHVWNVPKLISIYLLLGNLAHC